MGMLMGRLMPTFILLASVLSSVLFDRRHFWKLATFVIVLDALFTVLILSWVPYTEIDFETYVSQANKVSNGQRDYSKIDGPTGPLVYPAGHIGIFRILAFLYGSTSLRTIQWIYAALYLASLFFSCMIYHRARGVPNWVILLLPLSKRLHSIYVLRLFNDCWSSTIVSAAIYAYSFAGSESVAGFLLSLALSIKMNVLLYLPGVLVVLFKTVGLFETGIHVAIVIVIQLWLGLPFIFAHPRSYFSNAFDLSRQFLYKWTVNWRFIPEDIFLSKRFALSLLVGHLGVLALFTIRRWMRSDGGFIVTVRHGLLYPFRRASSDLPSGDEIITILLTSNLIGIAFARSLHYQFYSWYAQHLPLLLWRTRYPVVFKLALLVGIEYSWNVFPSTNLSSYLLNACHALILIGIWFGHPVGVHRRRVAFKEHIQEVENYDTFSSSSFEETEGTESTLSTGDETCRHEIVQ